MNVSRIRTLVKQGDMSVGALRYLLDCHGECEHLDYKEKLEIDSEYGCASLAKDVLGMKNVGGGYLVVGVQDKTWALVGIPTRLEYDTKMLRDKIRKGIGVEIEADIVQHEMYVAGQYRLFALILVRAASKRSKLRVPSVARIDFKQKENWGIRKGDIYVRVGDVTKRIDSQIELQNLLDELETRYQEEQVTVANAAPSPFEIESGLFRLLPKEYMTFIGREKYKPVLHRAIEADPRIWIVNLFGPGGVGKSALATWLAYEYYQDLISFEAILHLSAKDLELSSKDGIRHLRPTLFSLEDFLDRILHLFEHGEYCQADLDKRKEVTTDILCAYRTLLILDNMETIRDGRIMEFVRSLPPRNQSKVLLTSRKRTSEWEYPIQVAELDEIELEDFLKVRNAELNLNLPTNDRAFLRQIAAISGGLPLAVQWILGEYSRTRNLAPILSRAVKPDSPLLEFSFRNSWNALDEAARRALAVLSIFDSAPTAQEWRTALDWAVDRFEKAVASLIEVTFVTERTEQNTGKFVYSALPITLTFARNELEKMGTLEAETRVRYQGYRNSMELASVETAQYMDTFNRFDARTDNQKRAIILCRMAEGQARSLGYQAANQYYKQALDLEPRSVYALSSFGLFKMELGSFGEAIDLLKAAAKYSTKRTGYYVNYSLSRVYDQTRDRFSRIASLRKALEFEPKHSIARHSLGVALSQSGNYDEAVQVFDSIIADELAKPSGPSETLAYSYKTKIITLKHAKKELEAAKVKALAIEELSKHRHLATFIDQIKEVAD